MFFKENFAFFCFSWAQLILSPTINYEGKYKKIKTAELKACFKCFNLTIEAFALLCCFVVFNYHSIRNLLTTEKKESINHGRLFEIFTLHLQVHVSICEILICTTFWFFVSLV